MAELTRRRLLTGAGAALIAQPRRSNPAAQRPRLRHRNWFGGTTMWHAAYSDMPYIVRAAGGYLATLTVNNADEGSGERQHTIILTSPDAATWQQSAVLEPVEAPEASWGMPWRHPSGRVYVFYVYNVNDVRQVPNNDGTPGPRRADSVGVIAYKSTFNGVVWTRRRELELPATAIDLRNPWQGAERLLWLSGHPVTRGDVGYFGMSKMGVVAGDYAYGDTEGFVVKVRETTPGVLEAVLSAPIIAPPVAEEPSPIVFDDGTINVAFRTTRGRQGEAWSIDDGASWTVGQARDRTGRIVPQPRAKAAQFLLPDGRIFLWGHNNSVVPPDATFSGPRNPVYYRIGERNGRRIVWSPPRLLLQSPDPAARISYPSLTVAGREVLIAATDKATARLFRFPLDGLEQGLITR